MYKKHYRFFVNWMQPTELSTELYIHVLCTGHLQKSYQMLKTSLVNHTKFILQYRINRYKHQAGSLNQTIDYTKYGKETDNLELLATISNTNIEESSQSIDSDLEKDKLELIETINKIQNQDVKNILVITGYLIANLDCFRPLYLQLLKTLDNKIYDNVKELEQIVEGIIEDSTKKKNKKINIKDIIKALEIDFSEASEQSNEHKLTKTKRIAESLEELKYYLVAYDIL